MAVRRQSSPFLPSVILVTHPSYGDDMLAECVEKAAGALPPGELCVQLRDKRRSEDGLRTLSLRLRAVTRKAGALFVVNGNARVARDVEADGVHLGGDSCSVGEARSILGRSAWISVATHSDEDARRGAREGADAILVSPVFPSPRKVTRGLDAIRSARAAVGPGVLIYALGGVVDKSAAACVLAGADGVAVIRAILSSPDPAEAARSLYKALTAAGKGPVTPDLIPPAARRPLPRARRTPRRTP